VTPPTLANALRLGIRALRREPWLLAPGMLIGALRAGAFLPALAVGVLLPLEGAALATAGQPSSLVAPFLGAFAVLSSTRYVALVAGLALAGALLAGVLRVLFLAGALPTLGGRMAGESAPRRFASGVAFGLPRQLATAILGAVAEFIAWGQAAAVLLVALLVIGGPSVRHPGTLAALGAAACTLAVGTVLFARVLGDAAAARTALLGEGPGEAFGGALRRFASRPGAFLLGGLGLLASAAALGAALRPAAAGLGLLALQLDPSVIGGPRLLLAFAAALGAGALDLAWLATVGALACARTAGGPP
jgi:hypothetical protein